MADIVPRIVFCDLDDTFLSTEKRLIDRNMAMLDRLAERGVEFVPCTGRSLAAVTSYEALGSHPAVHYAISSSGSVVNDLRTGEVIHARVVGPERTLALLDLVRDLDVTFDVFVDGKAYGEDWRFALMRTFGLEAPMLAHVIASRTVIDTPIENVIRSGKIVERISIFNRMDDAGFEQGRLAREAVERIEGLRWTSAHPACSEVVDERCSKGEALTWLCGHLGIDVAASVAFGDSANDIEMLEAAGVGVAMGNAWAEAKAAADMIAPANDEAGVAVVLGELLGIAGV